MALSAAGRELARLRQALPTWRASVPCQHAHRRLAKPPYGSSPFSSMYTRRSAIPR